MTPEERISQLEQEVSKLRGAFQNFSDRVVFTKVIELIINGRIKLPNLTSNPTTGSVGELVVVNHKLKICTAATPTWTTVGTQT